MFLKIGGIFMRFRLFKVYSCILVIIMFFSCAVMPYIIDSKVYAATAFDTNIVINGDATNGLDNWGVSDTLDPTAWRADDLFPSFAAMPAGAGNVFYYYTNGVDGSGTLAQIIDISDISAMVDQGSVGVKLSGYISHYFSASTAEICLDLIAADDSILSTYNVGNTTPNADDSWEEVNIIVPVLAAGTQKLQIRLEAAMSDAFDYIGFDFIELYVSQVPEVTDLSPADDAVDVGVGNNLEITFSDNLVKGTGNITIYDSNNAQIEQIHVSNANVSIVDNIVTIDPTDDLSGETGYYVQIDDSAFKDSMGINFAGIADTTTWNFRTRETTPPTLVSAVRDSDTQITVTLSEDCANLDKANDGGFTVEETGDPLTTYAVSGIAQGVDASHVVLTVADMGISAKEGVTVKYTAGGNGTVQDSLGNQMQTDGVGVAVEGWDSTPATILSGTLSSDNSYIDVVFSEGIYGVDGGVAALTADKLHFEFLQNGGTATGAAISSVKQNDNTDEGLTSSLTGGETTVRVFLNITGIPDGNETIEITPLDGASIYDKAGNVTAAGQTTGVISMNDQVPPAFVSATRDSDTQITLTLSEDCVNLDKANDGGFTVEEIGDPLTTYAVSGIAQGVDASHVVLTVADMGISAKEGITVKYTAGGNGTVEDLAGNVFATDGVGVAVAGWDTTPATISSVTLSSDNSYIDVVFSEGIYGANDGTTALTADKLSITFTQNGGTATNVVISSVKKNDNTVETSASALTGGETTVRVFIDITGTPDGNETIEITPADGASIYDEAGNATLVGQTTGVKALNDEKPPSGQSVSFDDGRINNSEKSSVSFSIAGAEVGVDYSYTISSDGGGVDVTGSGTIATATDQISGIDVSSLNDGTLALSVILTDTAGNSAAAVTDTAILDITVPTVILTYNDDDDLIKENDIVRITASFSEAMADTPTISISNGGVSDIQMTMSGDNKTWVYDWTVPQSNESTAVVTVAGKDIAGNAYQGSDQLSFTLNQLPTAQDKTVSSDEDTRYIFTVEDFGYNDADGDVLDHIKITELENIGSLELKVSGADNQEISLNQEISKADIEAGKLVFIPEADANGTGYDSFKFQVNDGTEYSTEIYSMTIDVKAINDAPLLETIGDKIVKEGQELSFIIAASDIDSENLELTVTGMPIKASLDGVTGEFSWKPGYQDAGEYQLTFTISDGELTDSETIKITVNDVQRPDMSVIMEDNYENDILLPGEVITYRIEVKNSGEAKLVNSILKGIIPSNTAYVKGSTSLNGTTVADIDDRSALLTGLEINSPGKEKGVVTNQSCDEVVVEYSVRVFEDASVGSRISNQVELIGNGNGSGPIKPVLSIDSDTGDQATTSIVGNAPILDARKTVIDENGGNVEGGDQLVYIIRIANLGTAQATQVNLTDYIPEGTSFVEGSLELYQGSQNNNGTQSSQIAEVLSNKLMTQDISYKQIKTTQQNEENEYNINDDEIIVKLDTIDDLSYKDIVFKVQVNENIEELGEILVISSQGKVSSAELPDELTDEDGDDSNGDQATQINLGKSPLLSARIEVKDLDGGEVLAGDELQYSLTVKNNGNAPAVNLVINADIPDGLDYINDTTSLNGEMIADIIDKSVNYGAILAGEEIAVKYKVLVPGDTETGTTFTAQAEYTAIARKEDTGLPVDKQLTSSTEAVASNRIENELASVQVGGNPGSAVISGKVSNSLSEDESAEGWIVELYYNDSLVDSREVDENGQYSFRGLKSGSDYRIVLKHPETGVVYYSQKIDSLQAGMGEDILLAMDPSGVIYDSINRTAVEGAVVYLVDSSDNPVPDNYLLAGQQGQQTGSDGRYRFDIRIGATAPEGEYRIAVTVPDAYSSHFPSVIIESEEDSLDPVDDAIMDADALTDEFEVVANDDLPALGGDTRYYLSFDLAIGDPDIINNHIPVDPDLTESLSISKTADKNSVSTGDFITYTVRVVNEMSVEIGPFTIEDILPGGFKYLANSASIDGVKATTLGVRPICWQGLSLSPGEELELKYILLAGSGVNVGATATNKALVKHEISGLAISNMAEASVKIVGEPIFSTAVIIGKVFFDKNCDGMQNQGEEGLADIGIYTVSGQYITTDQHGRFHVSVGDISSGIGSNFILKLDESTLPEGVELSSENPVVIRLTPGMMRKVNFEVK